MRPSRQQKSPRALILKGFLDLLGRCGTSGNSCWWPRAESNHRHADFQSAALPTELLGREPAIISAHPRRPGLRRQRAPASGRVAFVARQVNAELLELPVQVRPLEPGLLGDARHAAVFLREVELEVALLERV